MDKKSNYFRLGLFVIAAILIFTASLVILIGPNLSRAQSHLETYFTNSISGLDVGSPVKFRGIPVGEVEEILLSTEAYPKENQEILSQKNAVAVVRMKVNLADDEVRKQIQQYIDYGLRVQTQLAGITGSLYLSMEFLDPQKYPSDSVKFDWKPHYVYVPSAPSLSNEIVDNVKEFLASLDSLDLKGHLQETLPVVQSLIGNLERIAQGLDPASFNSLGGSLNTLLAKAGSKVNEIDITQLNELIREISRTAEQVDDITKKAEISKLVKNLTQLSSNLNNMISSNNYDLTETIKNFDSIIVNLKNLTENLPANPVELLAPSRPQEVIPLHN